MPAGFLQDALWHPSFAHVGEDELHSAVKEARNDPDRQHYDLSDVVTVRALGFSWIARRFGIMCCMCGTIRQDGGFRSSMPFCKWITGYAWDGTCLEAMRTHPLCGSCNAAVRFWAVALRKDDRKRKYHYPNDPVILDGDDEYLIVLAALFTDRSFRERVEKNAQQFRAARFDPRCPEIRRAA